MNYIELNVKLRDNGFYPEIEKVVKKNSEKIMGLHLYAGSFERAEIIEKRLSEILSGVGYRTVFMPNHHYVSIELK